MGWEPHLKVRKLEYNDPHLYYIVNLFIATINSLIKQDTLGIKNGYFKCTANFIYMQLKSLFCRKFLLHTKNTMYQVSFDFEMYIKNILGKQIPCFIYALFLCI